MDKMNVFNEEGNINECETSILTRDLAMKLGLHELEIVEVPKQFDTIGISAFECCYKLKEVILHKNVKKISARSFKDCINLEYISGISNVRYLGDLAFSYSKLSGDINIEVLDYLGAECFKETSIDTFTVSSMKINIIPEEVFKGTRLSCITLPNHVPVYAIGDRAFEDCKWLEQFNMNLDHLEYVGNGAFYNTGDIMLVSDSSNLLYVGDNAFDINTRMEIKQNSKPLVIGEDILLKGNVLCYGDKPADRLDRENTTEINIFTRKDAVRYLREFGPNIIIPAGYGVIDEGAFRGLSDVISVDLNTVHTVGDLAFQYCDNLKVVKLGTSASPTSIGKHAFQGCVNLQYVGNSNLGNNVIKRVGSYAFFNSGIKYLNFSKIEEIEDMAFSYIGRLRYFRISQSSDVLGESCFDVKSVYLTNGYIYLDPIKMSYKSFINAQFDSIVFHCQQKIFNGVYFNHCENLEQLTVTGLDQFLLDKDNYNGCSKLKLIALRSWGEDLELVSLLRGDEMHGVCITVNGENRKYQ